MYIRTIDLALMDRNKTLLWTKLRYNKYFYWIFRSSVGSLSTKKISPWVSRNSQRLLPQGENHKHTYTLYTYVCIYIHTCIHTYTKMIYLTHTYIIQTSINEYTYMYVHPNIILSNTPPPPPFRGLCMIFQCYSPNTSPTADTILAKVWVDCGIFKRWV